MHYLPDQGAAGAVVPNLAGGMLAIFSFVLFKWEYAVALICGFCFAALALSIAALWRFYYWIDAGIPISLRRKRVTEHLDDVVRVLGPNFEFQGPLLVRTSKGSSVSFGDGIDRLSMSIGIWLFLPIALRIRNRRQDTTKLDVSDIKPLILEHTYMHRHGDPQGRGNFVWDRPLQNLRLI